MKILVLGDPHIKKTNLYSFTAICNEILTQIDQLQPDMCICMGDTLDTNDRLYLRAHVIATRFFKDIAKRCQLIVLIGNHDRENNSDFLSDIHPFTGLEDNPKITIVWTTRCLQISGFNFIFVPYVYKGRFQEALNTVGYHPEKSTNHPDLLFCHQEFNGCMTL